MGKKKFSMRIDGLDTQDIRSYYFWIEEDMIMSRPWRWQSVGGEREKHIYFFGFRDKYEIS